VCLRFHFSFVIRAMAPSIVAFALVVASVLRSSEALTGRDPRQVEVTAPGSSVAMVSRERLPRHSDGAAAASVLVENRTVDLVAASEDLAVQGHSVDQLLETETSRSAELRSKLAGLAVELEALATARRFLIGHVTETKAAHDRLQILDRHFAEAGNAAVAAEASRVSGVAAELGQTLAGLSAKLAKVENDIALKQSVRGGANTTLTELTSLMEGQEENKRDILSKIAKIDGLLQMQSYMRQEYRDLMESLRSSSSSVFASVSATAEAAAHDDSPSALHELRNELLPAAEKNAAA